MDTALEVTMNNGEYCLDSRVLAKRLGYEHETVVRSIQRHKPRLETKSILRQNVGKTTRDGRGRGRPETYYLLNERQCLILIGSLKKGAEAEEWHDALVDAFLQARDRARQLENQQSQTRPSLNSLWDARARLFNEKTRIPAGYWCIFNEIAHVCWGMEFRGAHLREDAVPDISVGKLWCKYARERGMDMSEAKQYLHHYPDKRGAQYANIYPNTWLGAFRDWFQGSYLKEAFPEYLHTHGLGTPAQRPALSHSPARHKALPGAKR